MAVLLFLVGVVAVIGGAELVVRGGARVAARLGISPLAEGWRTDADAMTLECTATAEYGRRINGAGRRMQHERDHRHGRSGCHGADGCHGSHRP